MVSLKTSRQRFETQFTVLDGGSGTFMGELTDTEQTSQPSYIFVPPRHVLRTQYPTPVKLGMVIQGMTDSKFMVGDNGPSENWRGVLWQSFRLFEVTGQYEWRRRTFTVDPITRQKKDTGQTQLIGNIWAALETLDRLQTDREIHYDFSQDRIITGANILQDDLVDNRAVTQVDKQLGLYIGTLT